MFERRENRCFLDNGLCLQKFIDAGRSVAYRGIIAPTNKRIATLNRLMLACRFAVIVGLSTPLFAGVQVTQRPQTFRSDVVLVPIDVRVLDGEGRPVTDLSAGDFSLSENGVPQEVALFIKHPTAGLANGDTDDDAVARARRTPRTFAIVLGRGLLNTPVKGLDALIEFVTAKLLPSDRLVVMAYLRSTPVTLDRTAIAGLLRGYRERHELIERAIVADGRIRPNWLSEKTRNAIDDLFDASAVPGTEDLPGGSGSIRFRFQAVNYLALAVESLRRIDGEKHLIFVSQQALPVLASSPLEDKLVRSAARARVAIHLLNTGGIPAEPLDRGRLSQSPRLAPPSDVANLAANQRSFASLTGGFAAMFRQPSDWLVSLERATRLDYLLGYYPRQPMGGPNEVRRIDVRVNRSGAELLFRRTYEPDGNPLTPGDMRSLLTEARIAAAAETLTKRSSIVGADVSYRPPIRISARAVQDGGQWVVTGDVAFDASLFEFENLGERHKATIDVAFFIDGDDGRAAARTTETRFLDLAGTEYSRLKRQWLETSVSARTSEMPASVRAVVFQFESDRMFSAKAGVRLIR